MSRSRMQGVHAYKHILHKIGEGKLSERSLRGPDGTIHVEMPNPSTDLLLTPRGQGFLVTPFYMNRQKEAPEPEAYRAAFAAMNAVVQSFATAGTLYPDGHGHTPEQVTTLLRTVRDLPCNTERARATSAQITPVRYDMFHDAITNDALDSLPWQKGEKPHGLLITMPVAESNVVVQALDDRYEQFGIATASPSHGPGIAAAVKEKITTYRADHALGDNALNAQHVCDILASIANMKSNRKASGKGWVSSR